MRKENNKEEDEKETRWKKRWRREAGESACISLTLAEPGWNTVTRPFSQPAAAMTTGFWMVCLPTSSVTRSEVTQSTGLCVWPPTKYTNEKKRQEGKRTIKYY